MFILPFILTPCYIQCTICMFDKYHVVNPHFRFNNTMYRMYWKHFTLVPVTFSSFSADLLRVSLCLVEPQCEGMWLLNKTILFNESFVIRYEPNQKNQKPKHKTKTRTKPNRTEPNQTEPKNLEPGQIYSNWTCQMWQEKYDTMCRGLIMDLFEF